MNRQFKAQKSLRLRTDRGRRRHEMLGNHDTVSRAREPWRVGHEITSERPVFSSFESYGPVVNRLMGPDRPQAKVCKYKDTPSPGTPFPLLDHLFNQPLAGWSR